MGFSHSLKNPKALCEIGSCLQMFEAPQKLFDGLMLFFGITQFFVYSIISDLYNLS